MLELSQSSCERDSLTETVVVNVMEAVDVYYRCVIIYTRRQRTVVSDKAYAFRGCRVESGEGGREVVKGFIFLWRAATSTCKHCRTRSAESPSAPPPSSSLAFSPSLPSPPLAPPRASTRLHAREPAASPACASAAVAMGIHRRAAPST